MAKRVLTTLVDDLDGASPADETVRFALDGAEYEIDLTMAHADEFRAAMNRYVGAARRLSSRRVKAG
ncbi:histone-like nucleoid-structuring protein Lsr2 [Nocardioides sp. HB32]